MTKIAKRQFQVTCSGISGLWSTRTGAEITAPTTKVWDGGTLQPEVLTGPAEASNIVVTRPFDYQRDWTSIRTLQQVVGRFTSTLSLVPTDRNLVALTPPVTY